MKTIEHCSPCPVGQDEPTILIEADLVLLFLRILPDELEDVEIVLRIPPGPLVFLKLEEREPPVVVLHRLGLQLRALVRRECEFFGRSVLPPMCFYQRSMVLQKRLLPERPFPIRPPLHLNLKDSQIHTDLNLLLPIQPPDSANRHLVGAIVPPLEDGTNILVHHKPPIRATPGSDTDRTPPPSGRCGRSGRASPPALCCPRRRG